MSILSSKHRIIKICPLCFVFVICIIFSACNPSVEKKASAGIPQAKPLLAASSPSERIQNPYNIALSDSILSQLRPGDLLVRLGDDITSFMLSQLNQEDKEYSHCGIVMFEEGKPYVYHSIGGEDNPDERLRCDNAAYFISPRKNLKVALYRYDLSEAQVTKWHTVVKAIYERKPLFDMKFDLKSDDSLYCAEFIYKSLNRSLDDSTYIQPSLLMGYYFVGVDNLFLNKHAQLVCKINYK